MLQPIRRTALPILAILALAGAHTILAQAPASPVPKDPWQMHIDSFSLTSGKITLQDLEDFLRPQLEKNGIYMLPVASPNAQLPFSGFHSGSLKQLLESLAWESRGAFSFNAAYALDKTGASRPALSLDYQEIEPERSLLAEFDFKGGTIKDLAEKIRGEKLGWTNIYVKPGAEDIPVPPFKVQRISFNDLRSIVSTITRGQCKISWTGTFLILDAPGISDSSPASTAILPLRVLLKDYKIEDINALVQTALKMRDIHTGRTEKAPDMSLHRETSSLVVVGSDEQVKLVQEVIAALQAQAPYSPPPPPKPLPTASPAKTTP